MSSAPSVICPGSPGLVIQPAPAGMAAAAAETGADIHRDHGLAQTVAAARRADGGDLIVRQMGQRQCDSLQIIEEPRGRAAEKLGDLAAP